MYFCASLSPPVMPATISPVLPSLLTSAGAAGGGAVHADVTSATCGDACSCAAMSVPTARASALCAPPSDVTLMMSSMSPWPNLSTSNLVALADSEVGSWNPPADRLLVTGMPKMPVATITSSAMTMIRFGAADGHPSDPLQHVVSPPNQSDAKLSSVSYQR